MTTVMWINMCTQRTRKKKKKESEKQRGQKEMAFQQITDKIMKN